MTKSFWIPLIVLLLGAFVAIVIYVDPFVLLLSAWAGLFWVGVPSMVVALIMLIYSAVKRASLVLPLRVICVILSMAATVCLSIPANNFYQERAVDEAKSYPGLVAPMLEQYRQDHGTYPASLDLLPGKPAVPRLLQKPSAYHSDGQHYTFTFSPPGGSIDVWDYDSVTHTWHLST